MNVNRMLFYAGLLIKILLGLFIASKFLTDLFIPFVDYFIYSGFSNPYSHFLNLTDKEYFPYPALMLYIMALPKLLFGWIAPSNTFINLLLYRLPLLIADFTIFIVMKNWLNTQQERQLLWLYWLSPVLLYISYMHGQFDVIPIAFLFASLNFLFKNKLHVASLLIGLSLATKTNIVLVYPFFLFYLLRKNIGLRDVFLFFVMAIGVFVLINFPYIFDPDFIEMVFYNQEQQKILAAFLPLNGLTIYLIPAVYIVVCLKGALLTNYNKNIFLMFLGFTFSIFLFFIPPMPGWYFWLMPFLAYFYSIEKRRSWWLYIGLQIAYIVYFAIIKNSDYLEVIRVVLPHALLHDTLYQQLSSYNIHSENLVNLAFTVLQTMLCVNSFWIYQKGLNSYCKHKITASPFLIGIGGDSGAGKSFIADALCNIFSAEKTCIVKGDDMHKWQRGHKNWRLLTHLNPKTNHLHREIDYLKRLKVGKTVFRRRYEHNTGQFTNEQKITPKNLIVYEGLHPFYLSSQRELYDLKIFIKPPTDLIAHWKILRDLAQRGYTKDNVLDTIQKREHDMVKYIKTQIDKADVLIEPIPLKKINNIGDRNEKVDLYYKVILSNSVYIEPIVDAIAGIEGLIVKHEYLEEDHQLVSFQGDCLASEIESLSFDYISTLENMGVTKSYWLAGSLGAMLLLLTYYIFERGEYDR